MLPRRAATDVRPAITDEREQLLDAGTFTVCAVPSAYTVLSARIPPVFYCSFYFIARQSGN